MVLTATHWIGTLRALSLVLVNTSALAVIPGLVKAGFVVGGRRGHGLEQRVTDRIIERSQKTRQDYLTRMKAAHGDGPARAHLSCSGQAHAFAAAGPDQDRLAIAAYLKALPEAESP